MEIGVMYKVQPTSYNPSTTPAKANSAKSSTKETPTDTYQPSTQTTQAATYDKPVVATQTEATTEDTKEAEQEKVESFVANAEAENAKRQQEMLKDFVKGTVSSQTGEVYSGNTDILEEIFGSVDKALPPMATTPEGAAAAVAPGGAYSVEAVSDRLMEMAKAFAGDDPEMIQKMQDAVKKGFEEAGMNLETGEGLPGISFETFNATMDKFEEWKKEAGVTEAGVTTEE